MNEEMAAAYRHWRTARGDEPARPE